MKTFPILGAALVLFFSLFDWSAQAAAAPFALRLDGIDDYVSVPHTSALNAYPLTVTFWMKAPGTGNGRGIVNKYVSASANGWQVFLDGANVRAWYFNAAGGSVYVLDSGPIADGQWHHVAFTVDASGGKLYVDGLLKHNLAWNGTAGACSTTQELRLGHYPGGGHFVGDLDAVAIWNVARTGAQIQTDLNIPLVGNEPNVVASYSLDEGAGLTAASLPAGNNGTLQGPVWVTSTVPSAPVVLTGTASGVTANQATLNGSASSGGWNTTAWFEYGTSTSYGLTTPSIVLPASNVTVGVSQVVTGLSAGTNYHFRLVASNAVGVTYGGDLAFNQYFVQSSSALPGVALSSDGSFGVADYDNDGDLDLVVSGNIGFGSSNTNLFSDVYLNDGNANFVRLNAGLAQIGGPVASGDFDNDGWIDFLITYPLFNPTNPVKHALYGNRGGTNFTAFAIPFTGDQCTLGARVGDFNNDGRLDFAMTGAARNVDAVFESTGYTVSLWKNNGDGHFSTLPIAAVANRSTGIVWGDFDNDDNLDLVIVAQPLLSEPPAQQFLRNNGDETFTYFPHLKDIKDLRGVSRGDYDNNGRLDLLVRGAPSMLFDNLGSNQFVMVPAGDLTSGAGALGSQFTKWGDFDNDGYLDVLSSGADIYRNPGDGVFSKLNLNLLAATSGAVGDFNNDGKLDFIVTRLSGGVVVSELWLNNTAISNTPPTAPTGLSAAASNGVVRFSWSAASDAQTTNAAGLSYNLRVGSTPGGVDVISPASDPVTGYRRVVDMGNSQLGLTGLLKVGPGRYYWSVQAIDTAFAGGPFAPEQSFWGSGAPRCEATRVSAVLSGSAVLHATLYPGELATLAYFEFGPSTSYGQTTPPRVAGTNGLVSFQQSLSGLAAGVYHFRLVASNSAGITYSADQTFECVNLLAGDSDNSGVVDHTEVNRALSNYWSQSAVYMTNPARLSAMDFQFGLTNMVGWNFNVEVSTNLVTWTNLPTGAFPTYQFTDSDGTNAPQRYYRLR